MIRISQGYNLADVCDAGMFEDRRRLFVETLGWTLPIRQRRFEIDQFDGPEATYIVEIGDEGIHRASLRLLPTARPHILGNLFPSLCSGAVPCGPHVYEITRLCLPTRFPARTRLDLRHRLVRAMVDHGLTTGMRTFTGVVRPGFRDAVLAMGWSASPLGPTCTIGGMRLAAFRIDIDADTPGRLSRAGIGPPMPTFVAAAA